MLAQNPRPPAAKLLVGSDGAWRVRIGDYRVIYDIEEEQLVILVLALGDRREVCR